MVVTQAVCGVASEQPCRTPRPPPPPLVPSPSLPPLLPLPHLVAEQLLGEVVAGRRDVAAVFEGERPGQPHEGVQGAGGVVEVGGEGTPPHDDVAVLTVLVAQADDAARGSAVGGRGSRRAPQARRLRQRRQAPRPRECLQVSVGARVALLQVCQAQALGVLLEDAQEVERVAGGERRAVGHPLRDGVEGDLAVALEGEDEGRVARHWLQPLTRRTQGGTGGGGGTAVGGGDGGGWRGATIRMGHPPARPSVRPPVRPRCEWAGITVTTSCAAPLHAPRPPRPPVP